MTSLKTLIHEKMLQPVLGLLKQGLTPEALANSLACGAVIAVFPVFGITTGICVLVAAALRLNQVAIQIANYCAYPLQFLLFIPFLKMGEWMFGLPSLSVNPMDIFALARDHFSLFLEQYGLAILAACAAWLVLAIPAAFVLRKLLSVILRNTLTRTSSHE
ncbi:DUF2062 domain-containing protein [Endozoicomonas arenosclerae]|uniref:DUF2062 domain-containing protein n=1 Tax=Endozoicomonas arenosclerae TaxID=1633495 RepID=UPI0007804A3B|nr:DUF2062 domain-containing protein [Endozoicomonas arenosclerae]